MPINLENEEERDKEIALFLLALLTAEKRAIRRFTAMLETTANTAAKVFEATGMISSTEVALVGHQFTIEKALQEQYRSTAGVFSKRITTAVKKKFDVSNVAIENSMNAFDRRLDDFIRTQSFIQAQNISLTTRNDIINTILQGQKVNLNSAEISRIIRDKVGGTLAKSRADMIARTETHNAATFSSLESTILVNEDLGLNLRKQWLAVDDSRTRPDHNAVDDKIVGMDEKFTVGGQKMSRPGDPRGGAAQVINCRCTLAFKQ